MAGKTRQTRAFMICITGKCRQRNHRRVHGALDAPKFFDELEAIHSLHGEVAQNEIGLASAIAFSASLAIARRSHVST